MSKRVIFTTIDLSRHADLCVCFRRDSYQCSFVDGAQRFDQENGKDSSPHLSGYIIVEQLYLASAASLDS